MDKRIRSPNYPALSLAEALHKVETLYRAQHTHSAPREVVARGMGYNSLNGASATTISAVQKYGLLERVGDELKVSERALSILNPLSDQERAQAIREAAAEPALFAELAERFPGKMPNDDLLRNYLVRRGFAPGAVTAVIASYRETSEMVEREGGEHDSRREQLQERVAMPSQPPSGTVFAGDGHLRAGSAPASATPQSQQGPVISMMEDHFIVNMVVRTREKARALRKMIEMVEGMLPDEPPQGGVSAAETNQSEGETIDLRPPEGEQY